MQSTVGPYIWVYARDERAWGGPAPPAAVYLFAPDRKSERPAAHLEDFKGILHVDGYAGFDKLTDNGDVVLAACWAHTRCKFYEVSEATGSPIAGEALRRLGALYAVEADARGLSAAHRLAARRSFSKPIIESLHGWLEAQLTRVPGRSTLTAFRYPPLPVDTSRLVAFRGHAEVGANGLRASKAMGIIDSGLVRERSCPFRRLRPPIPTDHEHFDRWSFGAV